MAGGHKRERNGSHAAPRACKFIPMGLTPASEPLRDGETAGYALPFLLWRVLLLEES